nr:hypothetical protein [Tanacetum cinerariifolium]
MGMGERKPYSGNLPKCSDNANVANAQRNNGANPKGNGCFECGAPRNAEKRGIASRDPDSNVVIGNNYDVKLTDGKIVRMEPIDMVLKLRRWILELSRSGIPLVELEEDPACPWERLQGNPVRLVRPRVVFLSTCRPLSKRISVLKRSDILFPCTLDLLNTR